MSVDVAVIGAGIVGAACARSLASRGLSVAIIDRSAAAAGTSSHCEGNLLVSDKAAGPELDLARHSLALWPALAEQLADELGPDMPAVEFEPKGGLVVTTTEAGARPLIDFAQQQRDAQVDARVVSVAQALQHEPWLNPEITAAVHYPEDCQIQPTIATEALLASARRHGAQTYYHQEVVSLLRDAQGHAAGVRTTREDIHAGAVIVAAGPWSGDLASRLGAPVPVLPRRGTVLVTSRMPHRIFHKVYDGDYFGATQSADAALQTAAVVESSQAGTVLIGSSREQVGFDESLRVDVYAEMARKALRVFPFLSGASIMRSYGGFRPYVPDHLPIVGEDPRVPGLHHASGHEGAGIGLSVATAELLTALIGGGTPRSPLGEIDPSPFAVRRSSLAPHLKEAA
ncbi:NAD(P)/FAD-dependent oxidoreductase [Aeromicrobium sp. CTD01-1L150]|uniref:NAD(P)/FAD-dependent oxidoreductase n=1 Tax=Aeromicrobium sp. CTD01-1L150 TaxID=3341830 RepID=UPI0035C0A376